MYAGVLMTEIIERVGVVPRGIRDRDILAAHKIDVQCFLKLVCFNRSQGQTHSIREKIAGRSYAMRTNCNLGESQKTTRAENALKSTTNL